MNLQQWWLENKENLLKRLRAFAWHLLCYMIVSGAAWTATQISGANIPDITVLGSIIIPTKVLLALALAQVTKWINNNQGMFGRGQKVGALHQTCLCTQTENGIPACQSPSVEK